MEAIASTRKAIVPAVLEATGNTIRNIAVEHLIRIARRQTGTVAPLAWIRCLPGKPMPVRIRARGRTVHKAAHGTPLGAQATGMQIARRGVVIELAIETSHRVQAPVPEATHSVAHPVG